MNDPLTPDQKAENMRKLAEQVRFAIKATQADVQMPCVECGQPSVIWKLYRCFECGCWFCQTCAGPHFGMVRPMSR